MTAGHIDAITVNEKRTIQSVCVKAACTKTACKRSLWLLDDNDPNYKSYMCCVCSLSEFTNRCLAVKCLNFYIFQYLHYLFILIYCTLTSYYHYFTIIIYYVIDCYYCYRDYVITQPNLTYSNDGCREAGWSRNLSICRSTKPHVFFALQ